MDLTTIETVAGCLQQAKAHVKQRRLKAALLLCTRATEIEPTNVNAQEQKGGAHFSEKDYDSAKSSYEKAAELGSKAP